MSEITDHEKGFKDICDRTSELVKRNAQPVGVYINFCPNCKGKLRDNKKLAQHVKECTHCNARWFQILTSIGKAKVK